MFDFLLTFELSRQFYRKCVIANGMDEKKMPWILSKGEDGGWSAKTKTSRLYSLVQGLSDLHSDLSKRVSLLESQSYVLHSYPAASCEQSFRLKITKVKLQHANGVDINPKDDLIHLLSLYSFDLNTLNSIFFKLLFKSHFELESKNFFRIFFCFSMFQNDF